MMYGITQAQKKVLDFIVQFMSTNGYSPSYRDIQRGLGYKSVAGVKFILDQLEDRGRITRKSKISKRKSKIYNSIQVVGD